MIYLLVKSIGKGLKPLAERLLPVEISRLDTSYDWSTPITTPMATVFTGHPQSSGVGCEILDWSFDIVTIDMVKRMKHDVYATYVPVSNYDKGSIWWEARLEQEDGKSNTRASLEAERWSGAELDERKVSWEIVLVSVPTSKVGSGGS